MGFTEEQLSAIESRNEDLLVSAAAGSGKTTVLVERIIRRVLDTDHPVDIDRILVMTFTKAAADQMRDKIIKAIDEKRAEDPVNRHLLKQSTLVHNAQIGTIHSFCLNVIKNHFQEIGLDPDFRVADEGECKLIKKDVLLKVLEAEYERADDKFIRMTECLASGRNDNALEEIIDDLYDFSESYPDPDKWLEKCVGSYDGTDDSWIGVLTENAGFVIRNAKDRASLALKLCNEADGPYMYVPAIENDISMLEKLEKCETYEEYRTVLSGFSFIKLASKPKSGPGVDPVLQERVKALRENCKEAVKGLADDFRLSLETQRERMAACAFVVEELIRVTGDYARLYAEEKRDKRIVDFSDLEHMCIQILRADDNGTAKEYREYFEEIYVDEYQDSNLVQEELLNSIARGGNLFMVGDVKQSIYSFRLARPQIFMDKLRRFGNKDEEGSTGRRIDLNHNFRSRPSVLDSVNELFSQIMSEELGGIPYDEAASLKYGADYLETDDSSVRTELMLIERDKGVDPKDMEARAIAAKIHELKKTQTVTERLSDGSYDTRPVKYSDIVILLRSAAGWDERFKNVIAGEGIPVHVASRTGYFGAREVALLLDYLTILDNPLQDIPMAAVLRSVFARLTDEELAVLRLSFPSGYLYEALRAAVSEPDKLKEQKGHERLVKKAAAFLEEYDRMRGKVKYTDVYNLLLEVIDGRYGTFVKALPDGKRRSANLDMLLKKAEDYGKLSYKGLFHFVKYIEMLKKYEVDYGEAGVTDEKADAVRIMTIHKSKGLEFPVCFVAGMHKQYNLMDLNTSPIPDIDLGLGARFTDPERRYKQETGISIAVTRKKLYETLAEEERILYVAMTRAKEKLIMTASVNDIEKALAADKSVVKCRSYLDLVIHGLNNVGLPSVEVSRVTAADIIDHEIRRAVNSEAGRELINRVLKDGTEEAGELTDILRSRFAYAYPYAGEGSRFEKVSVTELKRRSMHAGEDADKELPDESRYVDEADLGRIDAGNVRNEAGRDVSGGADKTDGYEEYVPSFIREQDKEIPATLHGTAVHRIFEIWDYERGGSDPDIKDFMEYVKDRGLMEDALIESVGITEVSGFVNSDLASRMKRAYRAGLLYREQPFMISFGDLIVQGIIDAYFIEDDEIVIVDYKTDRVADVSELKERYHVQLEYYAKALSVLLDRPVKEMLIYSTRHNKTLAV